MRASTTSGSSRALAAFLTSDLSAFYFDIRKDALYCDPLSSAARRERARRRSTQIFRRRDGLAGARSWPSPARRPGWRAIPRRRLGAPGAVPGDPGSLARRCAGGEVGAIRRVRAVVTGALEIERAAEADRLLARGGARRSTSSDAGAAGGCSRASISPRSASRRPSRSKRRTGPADAFRLDDVAGRRGRAARAPRDANAPAPGGSRRWSAATPSFPTSRRATRRRCANGARPAGVGVSALARSTRRAGGPSPLRIGLLAAAITGDRPGASRQWLLFGLRHPEPAAGRLAPVPGHRARLEHGAFPIRCSARRRSAGPLGPAGHHAGGDGAAGGLAVRGAQRRVTGAGARPADRRRLGNAYDRLAYGAVADFFYFHLGSFSPWGIFNVADIAIVGGVAVLLIEAVVERPAAGDR